MSAVLVLNISYEKLNVVSVDRAVRLVLAGKAEIVKALGELRAATLTVPLPRVIRMLYYIVRKHRAVALTKRNVIKRDGGICQYCGRSESGMTVDHVLPKSRGGKSEWTNLVSACSPCNARKGSRTPKEAGMTLRREPKRPSFIDWASLIWGDFEIVPEEV